VIEIKSINLLRISSAPSWFPLHGCIEMHGQQNIKKIQQNLKIYKTLQPNPISFQKQITV